MIGKLIKKIYKYDNVVLASGVIITAIEVTIQDDKVINIPNGTATVEIGENKRTFNFSIYNYGPDGERTYNTNNVPEGVSGETIIKEFVEFVEADII